MVSKLDVEDGATVRGTVPRLTPKNNSFLLNRKHSETSKASAIGRKKSPI